MLDSNPISAFVQGVKAAAERANPRQPEDYIGENGMLYCANCHTPKQCLFGTDVVFCSCKCKEEEYEAEKRQEETRKWNLKKAEYRSDWSIQQRQNTFAVDDRANAGFSEFCRRYADNFGQMRSENIGLLIYGDLGVGKSFYVNCIANAVLDAGYSVFLTSPVKLLREAFEKHEENIRKAQTFSLMILDDFGSERGTSYAKEKLYEAVNERIESCMPLIVTTNLTAEMLRSTDDLADQRIYDRLRTLKRVQAQGETRRASIGRQASGNFDRIMAGIEIAGG
jgi:DNA replication protein DnaC